MLQAQALAAAGLRNGLSLAVKSTEHVMRIIGNSAKYFLFVMVPAIISTSRPKYKNLEE